MARRIDIIKNNIDIIKIVAQLQRCPSTIFDYLKIYECYCGYDAIKSKMQRYTCVAEDLNIDETRVRRAINYLEGNL